MATINRILSFFKIVFRERKNIFMLSLPFILMDVFMRLLYEDINYNQSRITTPNILFAIMWILIIVTISRSLKGNLGRIFYGVCFVFFYSLFFVHYVYYPYTGFFFSFNLLESASEGKAYMWDTLKSVSSLNFSICAVTLLSGIFNLVKFPKVTRNHFKRIIVFIAIFIIMHSTATSLLGSANSTLQWDTWRNPRNVYESFNDSNKSIKICGLYEYSCRDLYMTFFKPAQKDNPEEVKFLENIYSESTPHKENYYTGRFKGKNVIFLQLEGLDSWLLNKNDTPTLYSMLRSSFNFTNHFSYYTGGGSTFNSELAVNTGFITPVSFTKNAYSFNKNLYPYSLPNTLKNMGYSVNAFHMNTGEYYMRDINYKNWGYEDYHSLLEVKNYKNATYQLDRELILNEDFYDKIFGQKEPFMHYIITYTPHTPFNLESKLGKLIAEQNFEEGEEIPELTEEDVARLYAKETDYMVELLLQGLKDNGLIDNTIIVGFSDHYLYTLNDKTILDKYKVTEDNRINQTPFFIWSNGMRRVKINKTNSQLDILPTVLNLLGVSYNDENYVGSDIMDDGYSGFVFFSDYSWFDGKRYIQYSDTVEDNVVNKEYIDDTNDHINNLIKKNDLTLKYDYFGRMAAKKKAKNKK